MAQAVSIVGGGPAGLACGIRLRQRGWDVTVHERGRYPLRKVCGEFLSPGAWRRLKDLGAEAHLPFAPRPLRRARFYADERSYVDFDLAPQAWGLRRSALDTALAARFRALGGRLEEACGAAQAAPGAKLLDARGRGGEKRAGPWMAWKGYLSAAQAPEAMRTVDLVLLPVDGGYVGMDWVDDGSVCVCLVARRGKNVKALLEEHPCLGAVADQVKAYAAISGFSFVARRGAGFLGDRRRVWPPVVGDGIHRALASGETMAAQCAQPRPGMAFFDASPLQFAFALGLHEGMLTPWMRRIAVSCLRIWPGLATGIYRCTRR